MERGGGGVDVTNGRTHRRRQAGLFLVAAGLDGIITRKCQGRRPSSDRGELF